MESTPQALSKLTTPREPIASSVGEIAISGGEISASSAGEIAISGGEIAHEALELHVALGEPDVARGDVGPLRVRMRLGDAQRLG